MQDYFTKWPEVVALPKVDSDSIINWLVSDIIPRYGVFSQLITDQGTQFVSDINLNFCKSVGINHKTTSPFHPQIDGMVEKFNRTFLNMVRNNVSTDQKDWHKHIPLIMFSYRTSVNDTTGVTPSEALQGRKFNLPINVLRPPILPFDSPDNDSSLDNLLNKIQVIRENVRSNADKAVAKRQKDYNNAKNRKISASLKKVIWCTGRSL